MSEMERAAVEAMAKSAGRVPEELKNRVLGYVEGYADGVEAARREREADHAEG